MRKIIESTLVSLDGVIGDPHVWAGEYFDDEAGSRSLGQLDTSDGMLMGRRTYEIFSGLWPHASGAYADRLNSMPKYVFSSTLERAEWTNTTIVRGDVAEQARELKRAEGRDLIVYGHGRLGHTLLEHGLLDEINLLVHPLVVGHGTLLFHEGKQQKLEHVSTRTLDTGVVALTYRPKERS
jgi:dihydrofolate reductase